MKNPWLTIPLNDYEGHMALPEVGQAEMLAAAFAALLERYRPKSTALIGCAGGNGFVEAANAGVERLVGIDINAGFVKEASDRFASSFPNLELHCADIAGRLLDVRPVDLVYAALLFEYVDVPSALRNIRVLCQNNGIFAALLQLPKQGSAIVSPSPFVSLRSLSSLMQLVPPAKLRDDAEDVGFAFLSEKLITLASGKQFSLQLFKTKT